MNRTKRITSFIISGIILSYSLCSLAESPFTYNEGISEKSEPQLQKLHYNDRFNDSEQYLNFLPKYGGYLFDFRGEEYITGRGRGGSAYSLPIKISGDHPTSPDCIWTGEYYYLRGADLDGFWYDARKYACPLRLFDANGEEAKIKNMRDVLDVKSYNQHAAEIGYLNGTYYALLKEEYRGAEPSLPTKVIKSTDFENWEDTDEEVPRNFDKLILRGKQISLNKRDFYDVIYEDGKQHDVFYTLGDWIIDWDENHDLYFTNDNIYMIKEEIPKSIKKYGLDPFCAYTYDNKLIINILTNNFDIDIIQLQMPFDELFANLDEIKDAPHVLFEGKYLGFTQPPIISNDLTLVPMRFLLEQMGANVEWDQETQTATAKKDSKTVAFSVGNTNASVNGTAKTMAVPAQLVNDKTMIPLRFLSENLGYKVTWDNETRTAAITTAE